jgi:hypothetical protein
MVLLGMIFIAEIFPGRPGMAFPPVFTFVVIDV